MSLLIALAAAAFIAAVIGLIVDARFERRRRARAIEEQRQRRRAATHEEMKPIVQVNEIVPEPLGVIDRPPRRRTQKGTRVLDLKADGVVVRLPEPVNEDHHPDYSAMNDRFVVETERLEDQLAEADGYIVKLHDRIEDLEAALRLRPVGTDPVVEMLTINGPSTAAAIGRAFDWSREERNRRLSGLVSEPWETRLVDFWGVDQSGEHLFGLVEHPIDDWLDHDAGVIVDGELLELTA